MGAVHALIVAENSSGTEQLADALRAQHYLVDQVPAADLAARAETFRIPDLLLVCASLGPKKVALAGLEFAVDGRNVPGTVVFAEHEDDFALLESCAQAGYDYLVPPFLPGLIQSRLTSCLARGNRAATLQDEAETASLRDYERQLSLAHQIQSGFLPQELPAMDGWELATRFRPAKDVSGDFYDAFELANCGRFGLVVADVCDKGVPAALFMALIRTLLRHTAEHTDEMLTAPVDGLSAAVDRAVQDVLQAGLVLPDLRDAASPLIQAVAGTSRYLARNHLRQGYFATMFFGLLDPATGSFLYINGGHNPPVLTRADGRRSLIQPTGPAVGMLPDSVYSLGHEVIGPGDSLFIYTDGVTEAREVGGEFFGLQRMLDIVGAGAAPAGAEELVTVMDEHLKRHVGVADQYDDITMMALRNTPPWTPPTS